MAWPAGEWTLKLDVLYRYWLTINWIWKLVFSLLSRRPVSLWRIIPMKPHSKRHIETRRSLNRKMQSIPIKLRHFYLSQRDWHPIKDLSVDNISFFFFFVKIATSLIVFVRCLRKHKRNSLKPRMLLLLRMTLASFQNADCSQLILLLVNYKTFSSKLDIRQNFPSKWKSRVAAENRIKSTLWLSIKTICRLRILCFKPQRMLNNNHAVHIFNTRVRWTSFSWLSTVIKLFIFACTQQSRFALNEICEFCVPGIRTLYPM